MSYDVIDHDTFACSPAKLAKAPMIKLDDIHGVLPFDGVRNPGSRSSTSHRVWLTYKTPANNWKPGCVSNVVEILWRRSPSGLICT